MNLEFYWYEISPFVYTVAGGFFLGRADAALPIMSAVLLLTAGGTILFLRRTYALRMRDLTDQPAPRERASAVALRK